MNTPSIEQVGDKARQGIRWSLIIQVFQKVFFYASNIVLARLLTPADFGLATMAITLDTITWIISCLGINSALIHYQDKIEERLDAAFWLFIISFGFLTGLQFLAAPYAAALYKAPILEPIVKVTAIAMFIYSFGAVHKTLLMKSLDFKKVSILEAALNLIKSVMYVVFAFLGFGVWSFIIPKIIVAVLNNAILWKLSSWRPRLKFHFKYWFEMLNYGKSVLFSNIIDYVLNNSSYILIGSFVGSALLGIYTFAYDKSMMIVSNIAYPINIISLPTFSRLQNHQDKLREAFFKTIKMISLIAVPFALIQIILAQEFITTIFGAKWQSSIPIFQMILCYSMFRSISQCGNPILQGIGKPEVVLKWNLVFAPIFIAGIFLGFKLGGIYGIGAAASIIGVLGAIIYIHIVVKVLNCGFSNIYKALGPSFISSCITMIPIILLKMSLNTIHSSNITVLITLFPIGILIYFVSLRVLFYDTFNLIIDNITKFINIPIDIRSRVFKQKV